MYRYRLLKVPETRPPPALHLRCFGRLQLVVTLTVCTLVYFLWVSSNLRVTNRIAKAWNGKQRRVVVFGDSFSDTTSYLLDAPTKALQPVRDGEEGDRWVEVLCENLGCDVVENFARTFPAVHGLDRIGAAVHNGLYANTTFQHNESISHMVPDFGTQVQQWIDVVSQRSFGEDEDDYLFTVFFGQWDLWQYATLSRRDAEDRISCTLLELFNQLDVIAEHTVLPPRVVVPGIWDLTFQPRFVDQMMGNMTAESFAGVQHKMISLVKYWNTVLFEMARKWPRGDIFVPDWNTWLVNEIRQRQVQELGIRDASGVGMKQSVFRDVTQPCLRHQVQPTRENPSESVLVEMRCSLPSRHLFWDDMQLGPTAHRMLGQKVAELVLTNDTFNWDVEREIDGVNSIVISVDAGPTPPPGYR